MNSAGGMKVFFLGATEGTLALIRAIAWQRIIRILRCWHVFAAVQGQRIPIREIDEMVNAINAVEPDVLWVGMTAPKQEKWIHQNRGRLKVKFAGAIGAVFDFYAGQVKRSHPVFQRLGLEWLPRLIQQPKRLWRRMFVSAPLFVWHVFKQKMQHSRQC
jgi:N-acetylglucosaminyldiphosphoundecaprenol N-acetyl-beta-D-mannosaminyltransferase